MEIINLLTALVGQITGSPAFIYVVVLVNCVIFAWELLPFLPSKFIPLVSMILGAVLFPFLSPVGSVDPSFPHPWLVLVIDGLLAGLLSFAAHAGLVKFLRAKFGWPPEPPAAVGLWLATALSVTLLLSGCAGTSAQRVLLVTSSAAAASVNAAYDLWGADALLKVKLAHPEASAEERVDLLLADADNREVERLYNEWRAANLLWSAANQTLTSGTNSVAVLEASNLRANMTKVGNSLLRLVSELTGQPQPVLTR